MPGLLYMKQSLLTNTRHNTSHVKLKKQVSVAEFGSGHEGISSMMTGAWPPHSLKPPAPPALFSKMQESGLNREDACVDLR